MQLAKAIFGHMQNTIPDYAAQRYKPTPKLLRPLQWIYSFYAMFTFVITLLIIFPLVVISSLMGNMKGGNFLYAICRAWGNVWLPIIGIFHHNIYEATIEKDKQYVFVANHISYMDIPVIFQGIRNKHFRILGKMDMAKIPVFGLLYRTAVVMVDRTSVEKRAQSISKLKAVIQEDISIYIYPEGTFNETPNPLKPFFDGAFRIAIETQTPIKPIVFLDTLQRLHHKSPFLFSPGKSRGVILKDISVQGLTMKDVAVLKEKTYQAMDECLRRYR